MGGQNIGKLSEVAQYSETSKSTARPWRQRAWWRRLSDKSCDLRCRVAASPQQLCREEARKIKTHFTPFPSLISCHCSPLNRPNLKPKAKGVGCCRSGSQGCRQGREEAGNADRKAAAQPMYPVAYFTSFHVSRHLKFSMHQTKPFI